MRLSLDQGMGRKALILARVGNNEDPVAFQDMRAETSLSAYAGSLHAEAGFEEQPVACDERQGGNRCLVHARGKLNQTVEVDVGRRIVHGIII